MALILTGVAAYAAYTAANQGEIEPGIPDVPDESIDLQGKIFVSLLPLEVTLDYASLSTISFLEGNYEEIEPWLRKRVSEIVYRNPFLGGWLIKLPGEKYPKLVFDPSSDDVCQGIVEVLKPGQVNLSYPETPYQEYCEIVGDHGKIPLTAKVINRNGQPLFRVALIPDALQSTEKFAVVVGMCRQCGDPYTFYRIYDMLMGHEVPIEPLNPIRKQKFSEASMAVMGKQEVFYVRNAFSSSVWEWVVKKEENPIQSKVFYISHEWIEKQQQKSQENGGDSELPSIRSTIASWFFNLIQPTVGFIPHNFRNSLQQCNVNDTDAGHYHNAIPYTSIDYATADLIDKSFVQGKRCGGGNNEPPPPLPRFARDATYAVIPDWSILSELPKTAVSIGGTSKHVLHMPLYNSEDLKTVPNKLSFLNIFVAAPSKNGEAKERLGAVVIAPESVMPDIESCGIVEELIAEF